MNEPHKDPPLISRWARGSRPIWAVVAFWLAALLVCAPIIEWMNADEVYTKVVEQVMIGFSGVAVGLVCFVGLLSALRWRSWSVGYLVGIVILDAGFLTLSLSFWLVDKHDGEAFSGLAWIPPVLLSLACPLIACRYLFGWRLIATGEPMPQRDTFRLEELFTLTTVSAANLVLLHIPQVIFEEKPKEYWIPMLILCGVVFTIGLFVLPLCVRLALAKRRIVSISGLALLAILVPACVFGISVGHRDLDSSQRFAILKAILTACGGATVALYASLFVLAWGGMSLVKTSRTESAVGEQNKPPHASNRWLAAASIAVAILVSLGLSRVEEQRRVADKEHERLSTIAKRFNGEIAVEQRKVTAVVLGQRAKDSDLEQFLECTDITFVDLSQSAITDSGVAKLNHFPMTTTLNLSNTQVTDAGLATLHVLHDLDWLELNDTKVVGSGFAEMNATGKLLYLELNNTPFNDAGCLALRRFSNLAHLSLAGTHVTDAGLQHLCQLKKLTSLNVTHTAVTGDGLSNLTQLSRLEIGGTQVDDAFVSKIVAITSLWLLDLRNTGITDETVQQLRNLTSLHHLTLTGTKVTGQGFRDWKGSSELETLTLSRTALTDGNVIHLKHLTGLTHLDLSRTHITDASLPILAQMPLESLNLCNTKITGAGLLSTEFAYFMNLQVAPDQCTKAEIDELDRKLNLTVTVTGEANADGN
jgi:hypothetical protein